MTVTVSSRSRSLPVLLLASALAALALAGCPGSEERACRQDCPLAEATVCGADGKDYLNECYADCGGTTRQYDGACRMTDAG